MYRDIFQEVKTKCRFSLYMFKFILKNTKDHLRLRQLKGALSGLRQFLATESPSQMMKNAFYFTIKAFFVLKIFKFFVLIFGHVEKDKVNFNVCGVTTRKQTIAIHILPNISQSKGNQTMKFG